MEADQDKPTETSRRGTIGPGDRLQAARIKQGLMIADVANRMHLSTSILEAIEKNNFDEITAPIFVKGYLRAYARIVALDEDEMIAQYLEMYSEEDPPISSTSNMAPELTATDARIKWTTYFVVILLAALLAAWWWNKQQNQVPPLSLEAPSATEGAASSATAVADAVVDSDIQAGSESATKGSVAQLESLQAGDTAAAGSGGAGAAAAETVEVETDTTAALQTGVAVTPAKPVKQAVEVKPVAPAVSAAQTQAQAQTQTQAQTQAQAPAVVAGTRQLPGVLAPNGSDKLRIIVHADTWADVKDANSYQLVYDLLRANSRMELSGQAPFVVFLGNGHDVEIQFNDEPIEFSSKIRDDNTTRLKIGG